MWQVGIVTISDSSAKGEREDTSGPLLKQLASRMNGEIVTHEVVPDDFNTIQTTLITLTDKCDLIMTTGGTGLADKDVTPEATKAVIHKEVPGLPEAMRMTAFPSVPFSILSRSVAGVRGSTLIINFPGSPKAVEDCFTIVQDTLPHALQLLRGRTNHT